MRLTSKLCAQHIDWWFKQQWKRVGKRIPIETGATAELERLGISFIEAKDALKEPQPIRETFSIDPIIPPPAVVQEIEPAYVVRDENVLLEGLAQAQTLTKTIKVDGFPSYLEDALSKLKASTATPNIHNAILASHVFDSEQKKLAVEKIPERPAFVLARKYGITDDRKNRLITSKLIFECEKLHGRTLALQRRIAENLTCHVHLEKSNEKLQLDFNIESMILAKQPLAHVSDKIDGELPNLFPIKSTISIPHTNYYKMQTSFPIKHGTQFSHPHTIFLHFSPLVVKNLYDTAVTDSQFQARNMLKAFGVAAAKAKQLYGENVTDLDKPIVVQSVQTNGKLFHFGVYQLNTLDINDAEGRKNYWFQKPTTELFHECKIDLGRPILRGYNDEVFKYFNVFYGNGNK